MYTIYAITSHRPAPAAGTELSHPPRKVFEKPPLLEKFRQSNPVLQPPKGDSKDPEFSKAPPISNIRHARAVLSQTADAEQENRVATREKIAAMQDAKYAEVIMRKGTAVATEKIEHEPKKMTRNTTRNSESLDVCALFYLQKPMVITTHTLDWM